MKKIDSACLWVVALTKQKNKVIRVEIEPIKKVTITEMIMEKIANDIMSGALKPGEKLATERVLAERFEVTRSRVREALRALALVGMIEIKPSGGSFVTQSDDSMPTEAILWVYHKEMHNISDVYAARKLLETEIYLACFENKTDEIVQEIEGFLNEFAKKISKRTKSEQLTAILDELDLYVAKNCGNALYLKLMQTIVLLRGDVTHKLLQVSNSRKSSLELRKAIVEAFKQEDRNILLLALNDFFEKSLSNLDVRD